ncbi:MAG TPA: hypothetical protein VD902_21775 [Symbiobacteriaceae bacterium]|nr:hypothetical protein [Symbiobacteriaceae bacterium]
MDKNEIALQLTLKAMEKHSLGAGTTDKTGENIALLYNSIFKSITVIDPVPKYGGTTYSPNEEG